MGQLFQDIFNFIKSLNYIDLLLYFAVLFLVILIVSLIYIIKTTDDEEENVVQSPISKEEDMNIQEVIDSIESAESPRLECTNYEEEQEEKAIISYDELIQRKKPDVINYDEEEVIDDEVTVKKISIDTINPQPIEKDKEKTKTNIVIPYAKEEEFLKKLKALNELLN